MQDKQLRLIEFFAGYGSQHKAFDYLDLKVESWKICEWAVKSIQAYKDLHFKDDNNDYSKDLTKEDLVKFLTDKGISANYNEPMSEEQIKRLTEDKLRTIYNNIKATHNLVNIQQVKGSDLEIVDTDGYDYMLAYSFPCVTESTLVLTEKGYIPFRELNVGDKVLTKSNTWQKVAKQFDNGVASVYLLNASGTAGIECTKEHKFYVREMYRKGHKAIRCFKEPVMKHAKDLITSKDYLGIPVIKDETPFYTDDVNFWYLIGMYLGDGWLHKYAKDIRFGFNDKKIEKFSKLGYPYSLYDNVNGCKHLRINNKEIYAFIEKYIGTGSNDKHIPIEILNLPKKQLQALYDGYLATDGCIIGNKHQFSSINESMSYSVVSIIHKLYNRPAYIYKIKTAPKKLIQGREVNQRDWYQIRFKLNKSKQDKAFYDNGYIWFPFKSLTYLREDSVYNMEIENDHSYIINGVVSANCQDLSLAGLGKGMSRDSGTRSGMLWEVERILKELKDSNSPLPKYLLMENVTQVHGENSIKDFTDWCNFLKSIGYTNSWADMNSKNFGIPQNRDRTFMVSILDNDGVFFQFPQQIRLDIRLKDLLEDKVDEKYYLSDAIVSKLAIRSPLPEDTTGIDLNDTDSMTRDVASTIKARYDCGYEHFTPGPTGVVEPKLEPVAKTTDSEEIIQVAQMYPNSGNPQAGRVYESDGLSPCLDTCQGGNREVKIVEETCSELQKEVCNRAVNYMQEGDVIDYTYSNSRLEEMNNGFIKTKNSEDNTIMNTLTTNSEAFGVCVKEPRICASRGRNPNDPTSRKSGEHLEQMIELGPKGLSNTLTTIQKDNYLLESNSAQAIIEPTGEDNLKRQLCNKLIEENMVSEGDVIRHSYTNSRFDSFHIENKDNPDCCSTITTRADCIGVVENKPCPTLDTRCDCLGVVVNEAEKSMYTEQEKKLFTEDGNIKRYLHSDIVDKFEEGQMATTSFPNGYGHSSRTHDESIALTTVERPSVKHNLRIRKLTPKECWRLMGIKDEDFEKVAENQSNASLYHLAGDSIVTVCLMAIFGKLFNVDYREKIRNLLKDLSPNFDFESIEPEVICERHNLLDDLLGD